MREDHAYGVISGNSNASFLNALAPLATLATHDFAVGHLSLTTSLTVVGGSHFGVRNDHALAWYNRACVTTLAAGVPAAEGVSTAICSMSSAGTTAAMPAVDTTNEGAPPVPISNPPIPAAPAMETTIVNRRVAAHTRWKSAPDSLPPEGAESVNDCNGRSANLSAVSPSDLQKLYAVKHIPCGSCAKVQEHTDLQNGRDTIVGFDGLPGLYADLASGGVPHMASIAPNLCHALHGMGNGSPFGAAEAILFQMGDAPGHQRVTAIKASEVWQHGKHAIIVR